MKLELKVGRLLTKARHSTHKRFPLDFTKL